MQERLVRLAFSGLIFLGSTIFFCWYFGFDFSEITKKVETGLLTPLVVSVLTLLIGSPAIGFIISTISAWLFLRKWSREWFYEIKGDYEQDYYTLLYNTFQKTSGLKFNEEKGIYYVENKKKNAVYVCHDVLFRRLVDPESLKYTARRLDMFWTNLTNISCIGWSILLAVIITNLQGGFQGDFAPVKCLLIVPFICYGITGWLVAKRDLYDSTEFEKIYLLNFDKVSSKKTSNPI